MDYRGYLACLMLLGALPASAQPRLNEVRRFDAPEATQGVAVDSEHFYAIANACIGKYDKQTGERVGQWQSTVETPLRHLNGGVVMGRRLHCPSSNFPDYPEASSVEVFDVQTMRHVDSHSFGIYEGSLTWIDQHNVARWACFAHYSQRVNDNPRAKPHTYTSLVRFDDHWRRTGGWVFPREVLERWDPHSSSGGGWGPGDKLYATGHDRGELYRLSLPKAGPALRLEATLPGAFTGQGVAWDKSEPGVLYGISRPTRQVVVLRVVE